MNTDAFTIHDWSLMMAYVGVSQKDRDHVLRLARFIEEQRFSSLHGAHDSHEAGSDASCPACQPIPSGDAR